MSRKNRKKKRAEASVIRRQLIGEIHKVFKECDADNTGMLTDNEVREFIKKVNSNMEDEGELLEHELDSACTFVLRAADCDGDGGISFPELVPAFEAYNNWTLALDGMRAQVEELMVKHDEDQSGTLDKEELIHLMTEMNFGTQVSVAVYDKIWASADSNGDGRVDLQELAPALSQWDQGAFEGTSASKYAVEGGQDSCGGGSGDGSGNGNGKSCCVVQ
jgi:Ca2+-binding EF-hand superfamily protein